MEFGSNSFTYTLLFGLCLSYVFYVVLLFAYRLFLSPIAHIPGPKLAVVSYWYEFYYDAIQKGQYQFHLHDLHAKYGPIIRINPEEIHINDPEFYDQVFVNAGTRKTDKPPRLYESFGIRWSVLNTVSHDLHRRRRAMMANHFSAGAIQRLQPVIRDKIRKLCQRLDKAAETGEVMNLTHAYCALTIDIITTYCFAESYNYLDTPEFTPQFLETVKRFTMQSHVAIQFPWLIPMTRSLPMSLSLLIAPDQAVVVAMEKDFTRQIEEVKKIKKRSEEEKGGSSRSHSIFYAMLDADVPEQEKSVARLTEEAELLILAGFITTAHVLEVLAYHLLANPAILSRLREELSANLPKDEIELLNLPQSAFEALPYLKAVIYEGLRLSIGVSKRLPRVSPDTALKYGKYVIPPGTPVSMCALEIHFNKDIFPEPESFRPERWLPLETVGQQLNKYLVPFSRGTRQCLGMNLAWAELYLTIPAVFGSSRQMSLYDVDYERDIKTVRDGFNPYPSEQSKGLRVTISKA